MINFKIELKKIGKKYNNEDFSKFCIKRLNKIVKLGGEIITLKARECDDDCSPTIKFSFNMPEDIFAREKMFCYLIEEVADQMYSVKYNEKNNTMIAESYAVSNYCKHCYNDERYYPMDSDGEWEQQ